MKGGVYVELLFGLRFVSKSEKDEGWPFDLWLAINGHVSADDVNT